MAIKFSPFLLILFLFNNNILVSQQLSDSSIIGKWVTNIRSVSHQETDTLIIDKGGSFMKIQIGSRINGCNKNFHVIVKGKWKVTEKYFMMMPPDSNDNHGNLVILDNVHHPTLKYKYKIYNNELRLYYGIRLTIYNRI